MLVLFVPLVTDNNYVLNVLVYMGIYGILAVGLDITMGLTGLFSLAHAAFYGMGAYASALLSKVGVPVWLAMAGGVLASVGLGVAVGIPGLRLRGDYLAIVTLGFAEMFRLALINWDKVTGGPMGLPGIPRPTLLGHVVSRVGYVYLVWAMVIMALGVALWLERSQFGRHCKAVRDDEDAAEYLGVNSVVVKVAGFAIGAGFAGLAGGMYAHYVTFVSPDSFTWSETAVAICMVVLGGAGTLVGSVFGATVLTVLTELLRFSLGLRMLLVGLGLVGMMIFRPKGMLGR